MLDKPIFRPIQAEQVRPNPYRSVKANRPGITSFSKHLQKALSPSEELTLSKHAKERLNQRGIHINQERWLKIGAKVQQAKDMGINDSLVLLKDAALIVSAKNNTVITAMNRQEASEQIFTNINGTIVLDSD
ncbi:flagellar operon protein [Mesobacillus foraminis]|uniref:Flagellar operon protein n=1 Tax=Mesobacillus foraminis TaxID=279826 RepID=A0A4R2BGI5_9BACI|nr:flagellar operon protein [Mesobacillus foraminis]